MGISRLEDDEARRPDTTDTQLCSSGYDPVKLDVFLSAAGQGDLLGAQRRATTDLCTVSTVVSQVNCSSFVLVLIDRFQGRHPRRIRHAERPFPDPP